MRAFALTLFLPASVVVVVLALFDSRQGDGQFARAVVIGVVAGLAAAVAYDLFRIPFVFARQWGISSVVPPLNLFKVFPAFGAMLLGQPVEQPKYSTTASCLGWAYHFSNGATIGLMYLALIGHPARHHWAWAVLLAVGLELGMLLTPYSSTFGIPLSSRFVSITFAAHAVFGVFLGILSRTLSRSFSNK